MTTLTFPFLLNVPNQRSLTCVNCRQPYLTGHRCPALRDLSPMGGGPR